MSRRTPFVAGLVALPVLLGGCGIGSSLAGIHDAPAESSDGASITEGTASQVAERVIAESAEVTRKSGDSGDEQRREVLSGPALREVQASVRSKEGTSRAGGEASGIEVLAVSRGTSWPRAVLATSRTDEVQYLHVLVAPSADQPYTLFADVPMAAGASVPALDPVGEGSPVTLSSSPPTEVGSAVKAWAKGVAFPASKAPKDVSVRDGFSTALKKNAKETNESLDDLATYTQRQAVTKGAETIRFELAGGGALAFVPMTRTDTITATDKLKELKLEQKSLTHLLDASKVKRTLSVQHAETLAIVTPAKGKSRVVGASEVIHAVKGH